MDTYTHTLNLPLRLGRRPVQARLDYTSEDPFTVTLTIIDREQRQAWSLDRDLLRDGRHHRVGDGDVQVFPGSTGGQVAIRLCPTGFDVTFEASKFLITPFLNRIYAAVPDGREHEWLQLDRELAELFLEADAEGDPA